MAEELDRRGGPAGETEETVAVKKGRGCGVHSVSSMTSRDPGNSQVHLTEKARRCANTICICPRALSAHCRQL